MNKESACLIISISWLLVFFVLFFIYRFMFFGAMLPFGCLFVLLSQKYRDKKEK